MQVLLVCTGNQCRSPMAAALLADRLAGRDDVTVSSAGVVAGGRPASPGAVTVLADRGLDLSDHRSRILDEGFVAGADLVVGMARAHVREAVVLHPPAFPRTFALKELVRRGREVGPRGAGEEPAAWLARVHGGRTHRDLASDDGRDDVADPIGADLATYARTAAELDALVGDLVGLLWPDVAPVAPSQATRSPAEVAGPGEGPR